MIKRPAIAMVELILAIVVMGIVMMAAPTLISTASKSTAVAMQQEGINEAVSRVNMILSYDWDQNTLNNSCIPPVLHVVSGDSELDEVGSTARRVGVPLTTTSHTFKCGNTELNASTALGMEGAVKDDIDDFTNTSLSEVLRGTGGTNYIEQDTVSIATSVYYTPDGANYAGSTVAYSFSPGTTSATSTNIKAISVTLTSTSTVDELTKTVILHGFSCNIGGYEFESRGL